MLNKISSEFLNPKELYELLWLPLSNVYRVKSIDETHLLFRPLQPFQVDSKISNIRKPEDMKE